jgi:hypothetical protein
VKVCILGGGPAGLMVAHAAARWGHQYTIYTDGDPSRLYGAQYLHQPIPDIDGPPITTIWHKFTGTVEGYRRKVYGMEWTGGVSPEQFSGHSSAWDIRYTYDELVKRYWDRVVKMKFTGWSLLGAENGSDTMRDLQGQYDMIFCTIPRHKVCINPAHEFKSTEIWAIGDAPDLGVSNPIQIPPSELHCSGDPKVSWYRTCNVFGHSTTEWPKTKQRPPITGVVPVVKPLQTNCDCWEGSMNFQGRYGTWKKGILTHHVFQNADYLMGKASEV